MSGEGKYKLNVELIGYDQTKPEMAVFAMSIVDLDGNIVGTYYGNSGPYGKGAFPGLQNEFRNVDNPESPDLNAVFQIQNGNLAARNEGKYEIAGENEGYFLHILTPGTGRSECGIHPDRNVTGTLGCLGLVEDDDRKFWEAWKNIPEHLRPTELNVYRPAFDISMERTNYITASSEVRGQQYLLYAGSNGEDVQNLESSLATLGFFHGNSDETFGKDTKLAVIEFQKAYGLKVDGIVGPETFGKLNEIAREVEMGQDVAFARTNLTSGSLKSVAEIFSKHNIANSAEYQRHGIGANGNQRGGIV